MTLLERIRAVFNPAASYGSLEERAFSDQVRTRNASGEYVTEHSALMQSAVWRCVSIIAEAVAMLPVEVIEKNGSRRVPIADHPVAWLLNTTADGIMTGFDFRDAKVAHALLWGNGYAEIERSLNGSPYALHLATPDRVEVMRDARGQLAYAFQQDGTGTALLEPRNVLHLRGRSWDGVKGYSVVGLARQALGLSAAMETFGAAFFGNGTHPSGVLTTETKLDQVQIEAMRKQWEEVHRGANSSNKTAILGGGLKWQAITMPLDDAQFLEGRRFSVLDVARWFGVPPARLAELERATHSNVEQEQLAFVAHCLLPWVKRFESEINIKLFGRNQMGRQSVKFNMDALLRGDIKTRFEAYQIARRIGVLNADEIRELEDRNAIPGGDGKVYIVEANMTTIQKLEQPPEPVPAPTPAADPAADPTADPAPAPSSRAAVQSLLEARRRVQS